MSVRTISLTIACLTFLLAFPGTPPAGQDTMRQPAVGMFLVASPGMSDPRFSRSVILLVRYSSAGAMGLIVNRRSEVPVSDALSELDTEAAGRHNLYFGGPVDPGRIMYVHAGRTQDPDIGIIENVSFGADYERLKALVSVRNPDSLRVLFGYAGWASGQLEYELSRGDWQVVAARADRVFSDDPGNLWKLLNNAKRSLITRIPAPGGTRHL
jgi:putative transcriptional regulator